MVEVTTEMLQKMPMAHATGIFFCLDPECGRPHVLLLDDKGEGIAHFVVPDDPRFMESLQNAVNKAAPAVAKASKQAL